MKSTKNGKIIYLYKSVNIIFLYINFLLKFENYHAGNLNKTYLVNIYFAYPARTVLRDPSFCFVLKSASDSLVLYSFGTRFHNLGLRYESVSMPYFAVRIFLDLKCEVACREYGFLINLKTSLFSSGDQLFLVTRFSRFL